jgi:hypothetical protein
VIIDGTTQPGFAGTPIIHFDAIRIVYSNCFEISAGNTIIRGFVINRCIYGIDVALEGNGGDHIEGNYLGTDVTGTIGSGNGSGDAVDIFGSSNNIIGGPTPADRNVISDNNSGIAIWENSTNNTVEGNYIGTDVSGMKPLPSNYDGIFTHGAIGTLIENNLIAFNGNNGIGLFDGSNGAVIAGNTLESNGVDGLFLDTGSSGNTIGAVGLGNVIESNGNDGVHVMAGAASNNVTQNVIAYNTGNGVEISGAGTANNLISQNAIYANSGLGIALHAYGNTFQASPVVNGFTSANGTIRVWGTMPGSPGTAYTLEFFSCSTPRSPTFYQGQQFLQTVPNVQAGAFDLSFTGSMFAGEPFICATATDVNNNTSEFSGTPMPLYIVTNTGDDGFGTLQDAIRQANNDMNSIIDFDIPATDPRHFYYKDNGGPGVSLTDSHGNSLIGTTTFDDTNPNLTPAQIEAGIPGIDPNYLHTWWSFQPSSSIAIEQPMTINGYSQPGSSPNTNSLQSSDNAVLRIQVNGDMETPLYDLGQPPEFGKLGFNLDASHTTVKGIVFNGFDAPDYPSFSTENPLPNPPEHSLSYVFFDDGNANTYAGNFFGTDVSGTVAVPNGIAVLLGGNPGGIGSTVGITPQNPSYADRNVISGNSFCGVALVGAGIPPAGDSDVVAGNLIGVGSSGNALGNGVCGIWIGYGALSNQIGGPGMLENAIAYNGSNATRWGSMNGAGIWILDYWQTNPLNGIANTIGNNIQANSIYGNVGLGIDLGGGFFGDSGSNGGFQMLQQGGFGPTLNDSQGHAGPNNWQNYPVLTAASSSNTSTLISGSFSESAEKDSTITLDFYANQSGGTNVYGQGQIYLGSRSVVTDDYGYASFSAALATGGNDVNGNPIDSLAGYWISATATDASRNTSEFSLDVQASPATSQTFAQSLAANHNAALPQSAILPNTLVIQANTSNISDVVSGLSPSSLGANVAPVSVYLWLAPVISPAKYSAMTVQVPTGMTLYIDGVPSTQIDPTSPALTILGGNVVVSNVTIFTTGNAPTILVTGGSLTLRNDVVQSSTYSDPAIAVTGGSLDLGTPSSPGGNTIQVNGTGPILQSTGVNVITSVGNTFQVQGSPVTPFATTTLVSSVNPSVANQSVTFTATVTSPTAGGSAPTGTVTFLDTTTGTTLGVASLSGGSAKLTVSTLPVNAQNVAAVYSGDKNYVTDSAILVQQVHYAFSGFLAPLNNSMALALNRTVPIKFQLTDYTGKYITSLSAVTSLQVLNSQGQNVLTNAGSTALRYDSTANQFIANWSTKGLPAGTYSVTLALNDGTIYKKSFVLSANGSSAALLVDGAGTATTAVGALLGGDVELYVDNSNGNLTADELARVQDAVTAVDAVTAPYGVTVEEVTDPTQADVTLNMTTTSAVGGYADGVLGCTTDAGQITIISGWSFYAGSDATQIGSGQYDFETVVTHELGHALGLGHSTDSSSVMYATLNTGAVNRSLKTADLNVPDVDNGACGLHAAPQPASFGMVSGSRDLHDALFVAMGVNHDPFASTAINSAPPILARSGQEPFAERGSYLPDSKQSLLSMAHSRHTPSETNVKPIDFVFADWPAEPLGEVVWLAVV